MAGLTAARRRSFGVRPGLHIESLDREQLVTESLIRMGSQLIEYLDLYDFDDEHTIRRIGWLMAQRTGTDFRIGRRLLQLLAPGGYLMPPVEFRLSRVTEPTDEQCSRLHLPRRGAFISGSPAAPRPSGASTAASITATGSRGSGRGCCISTDQKRWR